jgi:putative two-component system response regulator
MEAKDKTQSTTGKTILVVDDDPINRKVLSRYLIGMGHTTVLAESGPEALSLLTPKVDLILSDIVMPEMDGYELVRIIRAEPLWDDIPVVMVTTLGDKEARLEAVQAGAIDYINKPLDELELRIRVAATLRTKEKADEVRRFQSELTSMVEDRTLALRTALMKLKEASLDVVHRLCSAAESKDTDTGTHLLRISDYCGAIAARLGLSEEEVELIRHASPMHDIGKIAVPDAVLMKPGPLDETEWQMMRQHPLHGARILSNPTNSLLVAGEQIARTHHERFDGSGYPNGLCGTDIPLFGRICAVADVFDALTTKRPYKEAFPMEQAVKIMVAGRGSHFDPQVLDVFLGHLVETPLG